MIAYARFGNAKIIEELRNSYGQLEEDLQQQATQLQEFSIQNKILKSRAQQLLDQNEDYSKVISQLSRFYFRLKQASDKLKELTALVSVVDEEDLSRKIDTLVGPMTPVGDDEDDLREQEDDQKKFF
jgi:chromosome segregation ATPase